VGAHNKTPIANAVITNILAMPLEEENHRMTTGKKPASTASKELSNKKSTPAEKTVAASDLAQAKKPTKKK